MRALAQSEDRFFTARHMALVGLVGSSLIVAVLAGVVFSTSFLVQPDGTPTLIDFTFIWLGGRFAGSPHPADTYNYAEFARAQVALFAPIPSGIPYFRFLYPPPFMLFAYPFGLLPYFAAFALWVGATLLLYMTAVYLAVPRGVTVLLAGAPLTVFANAILGQNGFLTAGLIGLSLAVMQRRPVLSGIFFGLLSYKPQFAVLFPLALVAGGRWRALAAAAATAAIMALLAGSLVGPDAWVAFIDTLRGFDTRLSPDAQLQVMHQSVFALCRWLGAGIGLAWAVHLTAAAAVAAVVAILWFRPTPYPLQAAALCVGAVATTPYVVIYDLCVLSVAAAFLVRDSLDRGFHPGERTFLFCLNLSLAAAFLRVPVGPVVVAGLLALIVLRAMPRGVFQPCGAG